MAAWLPAHLKSWTLKSLATHLESCQPPCPGRQGGWGHPTAQTGSGVTERMGLALCPRTLSLVGGAGLGDWAWAWAGRTMHRDLSPPHAVLEGEV